MPTIEQARAWYPVDDPVHGFDHILRVYQLAERLARAEGADLEIVRAAALLHDASPLADLSTPEDAQTRGDHHQVSAEFAGELLRREGWPEERIAAVQHCVRAHRFRDEREMPQTLEAQVLFDADKLDAIGAIGVARAVAYAARAGQPFFQYPSRRFLEQNQLEAGEGHSAFHEYLFKLSKLKDRLYTPSGKALGEARHRAMAEYFERLAREICGEL